jgi:hypothetical protein
VFNGIPFKIIIQVHFLVSLYKSAVSSRHNEVQILLFLSKEIQKASFEANIEIEFYFSSEKQSATCVLSHLNIFGSKLLTDFQISKTFFVPAKNNLY